LTKSQQHSHACQQACFFPLQGITGETWGGCEEVERGHKEATDTVLFAKSLPQTAMHGTLREKYHHTRKQQ